MNAAQARQSPAVYILHGADEYRRSERIAVIRKELDPEGTTLPNNTTRFDPAETRSLKPADLQNACQAASFFETSRLVIIEGLQARLSGAGRRGSRRRATDTDDADGDDSGDGAGGAALSFFEVLLNLPPSTTVIISESGSGTVVTQMTKLADARYGSSDYLKVESFPELKGPPLMAWAMERAQQAGYQFAPAAMNRLLTMVDGSHTGDLANEIDKVGLYALGRTVSVQDVDAVASAALSYMPWDITDPIVEGRADRALRLLQTTGEEFHPMVILAMMRNQFRRLLLVQSMTREGVPMGEIGRRLNMKEFPLKKAMDQGGRFPNDALERAFRLILRADADVKTGILPIETVLPALIAEIAELQRRQAGRPISSARR